MLLKLRYDHHRARDKNRHFLDCLGLIGTQSVRDKVRLFFQTFEFVGLELNEFLRPIRCGFVVMVWGFFSVCYQKQTKKEVFT